MHDANHWALVMQAEEALRVREAACDADCQRTRRSLRRCYRPQIHHGGDHRSDLHARRGMAGAGTLQRGNHLSGRVPVSQPNNLDVHTRLCLARSSLNSSPLRAKTRFTRTCE